MEREGEQQLVYFTSHALQAVELRYKWLEKLILNLLLSLRRLKYYFQQHPMVVRTDQPIKQVVLKPELAGRMANWGVELQQYHIEYDPRKAVKSQALLDFVIEMTIPTPLEAPPTFPVWNINVDGSCGKGGSGVGVTITAPNGVIDQAL